MVCKHQQEWVRQRRQMMERRVGRRVSEKSVFLGPSPANLIATSNWIASSTYQSPCCRINWKYGISALSIPIKRTGSIRHFGPDGRYHKLWEIYLPSEFLLFGARVGTLTLSVLPLSLLRWIFIRQSISYSPKFLLSWALCAVFLHCAPLVRPILLHLWLKPDPDHLCDHSCVNVLLVKLTRPPNMAMFCLFFALLLAALFIPSRFTFRLKFKFFFFFGKLSPQVERCAITERPLFLV